MNIVSIAPGRSGVKTYGQVSMLFKAFCATFVLLGALPVTAAETGIRGIVTWGPVKPGPARLGQSDEAPLSATFLVFSAEREVAQFKSDQKGNFEVLLPPGDYTVVPDKSTRIPAPRSQKKSVNVPADGFIEVTLSFDTGMR